MIQHHARRPGAAAAAVVALAALGGPAGCSGGPGGPPPLPPLMVSDRGGALRIYEVDRVHGLARLVGSPRADDRAYADRMPARLADGRVVFISDRGGRPALHVAGPDPDGATALPIAADPAAGGPTPGGPGPADSDPAPCGPARLLFARAGAGGAPRDLQIVGLDGGGLRPLTRHAADDGAPCALPDGRTIVFVSDRGGSPRLYRLDADAPDPEATVTPLLPDGAGGAPAPGDGPASAGVPPADGAPACLANGSIVFARAHPGLPPQLAALDPAGGRPGPRQITDAAILPFGADEPVALDDGTILFTAGPARGAGGGAGGRYGVYRISGGGYNLSRLTREGAGYDDFARALDARR